MNALENIETTDNTIFVLRDANGRIKPLWQPNTLGRKLLAKGKDVRIPFVTGRMADCMTHHNIITNVGHAAANAKITAQGSYGTFTKIAIGQGTNAAAATDCALSVEITANGGQRTTATPSQVTTTVTNDTSSLAATFTFTGAFAVTEEGIFDATTTPTITTTTQSRITTDTTVTVTSGTGIANNDFLQWEAEIVQVTSGGGTGTLTITRAQKGTTAATHASGTSLVDFTAGGGNLMARQQFSVVNVASGDSLSVVHKLQT